MADVYSTGIGETVQGVSIDNTRRVYNFGDRVAELAPMESPFFVYLSRVAKRPTDDPVFKFLEQRHQWQRRNFNVQAAKAPAAADANMAVSGLRLGSKYDKYGITTSAYKPPQFLLPGQVITLKGSLDADGAGAGTATGVVVTARITAVGAAGADYTPVDFTVLAIDGDTSYATTNPAATLAFVADDPGQVTGSAFAEGTGAPGGWSDSLYNREGYTQIFKTSCPMFSGSSLATRYRGISNEFTRVWSEKLMEHKMDIEEAMLFGVGSYAAENGTDPKRYTWGIVPYTERFGKVFNFTYASSTYDDFIDMMKDFHSPESGNSRDKLYLASRDVIAWLHKLQGDSFLKNTVGATQYRLDVANIPGQFGHEVTRIRTVFGSAHFIEEPLLRGVYKDYVVGVDLRNVAYRPLAANGVSRDTHITTNVQNNDTDGRKDLILTEAGLEIALPETCAIMKWS